MRYTLISIILIMLAFTNSQYSIAGEAILRPLETEQQSAEQQATAPVSGAMALRWGPLQGLITPHEAFISWATTRPGKCVFQLNGSAIDEVKSKGFYHKIQLTGLAAGTKHTGRIIIKNGQKDILSDSFIFTTPPASNQKALQHLTGQWNFIAFGDTRTNHKDHQKVMDSLLREQPGTSFVIHTGDLVQSGDCLPMWDQFFAIEGRLMMNGSFIACRGNHEKQGDPFKELFYSPSGSGNGGKTWFSYRYNNAQFVVLDPLEPMEPQTRFLENVLSKAQDDKVKWKFVAWHNPPYSSGRHGNDQKIIDAWVPLLEKYGVNAGFFGHDHMYEHSLKKNTHYFILGGGGAPLYKFNRSNPWSLKTSSTLHFARVDVSDERVIITVIKPDGSLLDEVTIK
jgi:predicted phosphodiesterase